MSAPNQYQTPIEMEYVGKLLETTSTIIVAFWFQTFLKTRIDAKKSSIWLVASIPLASTFHTFTIHPFPAPPPNVSPVQRQSAAAAVPLRSCTGPEEGEQ